MSVGSGYYLADIVQAEPSKKKKNETLNQNRELLGLIYNYEMLTHNLVISLFSLPMHICITVAITLSFTSIYLLYS